MSELRTPLIDLTNWCLQVVGLAWLLAAVYFAVRLPDTPRRKLLHFLRTFLPEPWLLPFVPVLVIGIRLVPAGVWAHLRLWNPVLAIVGAALVAASTVLMLWARGALGTMWAGRPLLQEHHELRTDGPYRVVRHPIYAGFAGLAVGSMLVFGFGALVAVCAFALLFVAWRVWREERLLVATFGERYRAYRRQVPALVPLLRHA
jgi:protein-S-isoprenylcysteine O-methyltransferase Ste14